MSRRTLAETIERAQILGHVGPGEIDNYIEHGLAHLEAANPDNNSRWCDLGSGGGLPGLVVALQRPDLEVTLLDRSLSRTQFLEEAVIDVGLGERVEVVNGDATDLAHDPLHRSRYDGVFSRSFAAPAVTAECAAAFLCPGGILVVSEPPEPVEGRWPAERVQSLGLSAVSVIEGPPRFVTMKLLELPEMTVPRKWAQIVKNPLF